jgi:predicted acetyltransferase
VSVTDLAGSGTAASATETEIKHEPREDGGFKLRLSEGGKEVARLDIGKYTMRLAGADVTMGGVGNVVTRPANRGRGFGARMLRAAVARMREERYPVSILWGISDFYHRFGYVPGLPGYTLTVNTRNAERLASGELGGAGTRVGAGAGAGDGDSSDGPVEVRAGRVEDAQALLELYEWARAERSGTLRRDTDKFDPSPPQDDDHWWVHPRRVLVAEVRGRPAGYVLLHGNPAQQRVLEAVVPAEQVETAGLALVGELAREAVERRLGEIQLPLPPDEPLTQLLRRAGCKVEVNYPANGGGMGRIVHLGALAEAIQPSLAARVELLPNEQRPGRLELVCVAQGDEAEERATIELGSAGGSTTLTLPQQALCQLLMGYRGIDAIRLQHRGACDEGALPALRALFPEGYPHMWSIDHF